jgi:hypothetical protein
LKLVFFEWLIPVLLGIGIVLSVAFQPEAISIVVATLAAIFAGVSALLSRKSLQIVRRTQRPFVNVSRLPLFGIYDFHNQQTTIQGINFNVSNRGNFPADNLSITCEVNIKDMNSDMHYLSLKKEEPAIPTILFPSEEVQAVFEEKGDDSSALKIAPNDRLTIKLTINYKNILLNENHRTIRVWQTAQVGPCANRLIPLPNMECWN